MKLMFLFAVIIQTTFCTKPPGIDVEPDSHRIFKPGDSIVLDCNADGYPAPQYSWKKNDMVLDTSGFESRIWMATETGRLSITNLKHEDGGFYQCLAENQYGVSISNITFIQAAFFRDPASYPDMIYEPKLGDSFVLQCLAASSYPPPDISWVRESLGNLTPVRYDNRVTIGQDGNLIITNIVEEDRQDDRPYICKQENRYLQKTVHGRRNYIRPVLGLEKTRPVTLLSRSQSVVLGLLGEVFRMKCVFGGNPTPDVSWEKLNGNFSERHHFESYGQELVISDLLFSDAGDYECRGFNLQSVSVSSRISLTVESRPSWVQQPHDIQSVPGATVTFICQAGGTPSPQIVWFINGVRLEDVTDPRIISDRFLKPNEYNITLVNLTRDDAMVVQCNATNKHGYIFSDVYLNVLLPTRPPSISLQPPFDVYFKASKTVQLPCVADGNPIPQYNWKKDGVDFNPSGNDGRIVQLANAGTIVISKPEHRDEGLYQCFAENIFGTSLTIIINLKEAISLPFLSLPDQTYRPQLGAHLTLNCIPPMSYPPAEVYWVFKNETGDLTAFNYSKRVTMDPEYRLRITNVISEDHQGDLAYVCIAINSFMRQIQQSHRNFIQPWGTIEEKQPVSILWAPPSDYLGLLEEDLRLKCIFAGNPTPNVFWRRNNGSLPEHSEFASFSQELLIPDLRFSDAGEYECMGTNSETVMSFRRSVTLRVESRPYWIEEPRDIETSIGAKATFLCRAGGIPTPRIYWFINGVPMSDLKKVQYSMEIVKNGFEMHR
ncbi:hypothetical protein ScPMuIL_007957 [Solemya velum]